MQEEGQSRFAIEQTQHSTILFGLTVGHIQHEPIIVDPRILLAMSRSSYLAIALHDPVELF